MSSSSVSLLWLGRLTGQVCHDGRILLLSNEKRSPEYYEIRLDEIVSGNQDITVTPLKWEAAEGSFGVQEMFGIASSEEAVIIPRALRKSEILSTALVLPAAPGGDPGALEMIDLNSRAETGEVVKVDEGKTQEIEHLRAFPRTVSRTTGAQVLSSQLQGGEGSSALTVFDRKQNSAKHLDLNALLLRSRAEQQNESSVHNQR